MWMSSVSVTVMLQSMKMGIISQAQGNLWDLCVSASANKQVVDLSEELARKVEDCLRQQEEISSLLAQIVDLQARCKGVRGSHMCTAFVMDYIKYLC